MWQSRFFSRERTSGRERAASTNQQSKSHPPRPGTQGKLSLPLHGSRRERRKAKLDGATAVRSLCRDCARLRPWRPHRPIRGITLPPRTHSNPTVPHTGCDTLIQRRTRARALDLLPQRCMRVHMRVYRCIHTYTTSRSGVGQAAAHGIEGRRVWAR